MKEVSLSPHSIPFCPRFYFLDFRLMIERWTFKISKLDPIAATKASAADTFNDKKIKLKIAMQIQKPAILIKNKISLRLASACASGA